MSKGSLKKKKKHVTNVTPAPAPSPQKVALSVCPWVCLSVCDFYESFTEFLFNLSAFS